MADENWFKDVQHLVKKDFGSLGGDAVTELFSAHTQPSEDGTGVDVRSLCANCGQPTVVSASWLEVVLIRFKRKPDGWFYDGRAQMFRPELRCKCSWPIEVGLTPDECYRYVVSATEAGKITQQQVNQVGVQVGAIR